MNNDELRKLAGVIPASSHVNSEEPDITLSPAEKAEYMKKHNIRPGDQAWFQLWFARPKLTGENPTPKR